MKWALTVAVVVIAFAATAAVELTSASVELQRVALVFWLWFAFGALNFAWAVLYMPAVCRFTPARLRRDGMAAVVRQGARDRWFWDFFWLSLLAIIVSSLAPLGLLWVLPSWSALVVFALNLATNAAVPPLRLWIWRVTHEA